MVWRLIKHRDNFTLLTWQLRRLIIESFPHKTCHNHAVSVRNKSVSFLVKTKQLSASPQEICSMVLNEDEV
jgi:hypothetical protein